LIKVTITLNGMDGVNHVLTDDAAKAAQFSVS